MPSKDKCYSAATEIPIDSGAVNAGSGRRVDNGAGVTLRYIRCGKVKDTGLAMHIILDARQKQKHQAIASNIICRHILLDAY